MKKIFLFTFIFVLLLSSTCLAITAEKFDVDVQINSDGSADVIEATTLDFEKNYNGVFIDINYKNGLDQKHQAERVSNIRVNVDGEFFNFSDSTVLNGTNGVYTITDDGRKLSLKIYMPSDNTQKVVTLSYKLENIIVKYEDVAEFYWNFLSPEVEYETKNVDITIKTPDQVDNISDLRVWGHGLAHGESNIIDNHTVKLTIDSTQNAWLGARVAFPANLIDENYSRTYTEPALDKIVNDETELADKSNQIRESSRFIVDLIYFALISIIIFGIALLIHYYRKYGKELEPEFWGDYYRELPAEYSPAIMSHLLSLGSLETRNILAVLLDLYRRGFINIEEVDKNDFKITRLKEDTTGMTEQEKYLLSNVI
jgi:uncharacterized membrane protein